jgi:hypothetical protein
MPKTIRRPASHLATTTTAVTPSVVDPNTARPFTLEQELAPFGRWVQGPLWVPPQDASLDMAETMLTETGPFTSKAHRWASVIENHRAKFTQVREFDLFEASIRLPKGRFFVSVTEQQDFDQISDTIPNCVQTRLDEFLAGPGKQPGVKVFYLKPLCVEVGDDLILTTGEDVVAAVEKIQDEVFAEYRRLALYRRPLSALVTAANLALAPPRSFLKYVLQRRQRAIDAYQAQLEFKRRKTALGAMRTFQKCRTSKCSFDDMLELTNPLVRTDVIEQYCIEEELSKAKREQLMLLAAGTVPWFVALSLSVSFASTVAMALATPPVVVCDPAFVAEMPGAAGVLLKIGHFDEVGGITHVEI